MTDVWRPVVGAVGFYEVSDQGQIRSIDRVIRAGSGKVRRHKGRSISPSPVPSGYLIVTLSLGERRESGWLHRLVAKAFLGPCPQDLEVRHRDGNPANNRLTNLVYGTRSENALDRVAHGTDRNARKTHCKWGHEFDFANTLLQINGSRKCRRCKAARDNRRYAKSKEQ